MGDTDYGGQERRANWAQADHDILIEVRTIVQRMDRENSAERRDIWERFGKHDERLVKMETLAATLQPEKSHERYDHWGSEWERFKNRWQGFALALGILGSLLTWLLQNALAMIR